MPDVVSTNILDARKGDYCIEVANTPCFYVVLVVGKIAWPSLAKSGWCMLRRRRRRAEGYCQYQPEPWKCKFTQRFFALSHVHGSLSVATLADHRHHASVTLTLKRGGRQSLLLSDLTPLIAGRCWRYLLSWKPTRCQPPTHLLRFAVPWSPKGKSDPQGRSGGRAGLVSIETRPAGWKTGTRVAVTLDAADSGRHGRSLLNTANAVIADSP